MSEQSKPAEKCFAEHMHIHESGWTNCACDRDAGHDDDYHEDSSVQVRWPVKAPVKGYVVRGTNPSGTVGYAVGRDGTLPIAVANYQGAKTVYALLDVADSAAVDLRREGCTGVRVYRVHADGSETPMPTYTELAVKAKGDL